MLGLPLSLPGEKRSERKEEGEGYFFSEREYGRFQRSFRLPADAKEGAVEADFANGVLKIKVPRMAAGTESGAKQIKVTAS